MGRVGKSALVEKEVSTIERENSQIIPKQRHAMDAIVRLFLIDSWTYPDMEGDQLLLSTDPLQHT